MIAGDDRAIAPERVATRAPSQGQAAHSGSTGPKPMRLFHRLVYFAPAVEEPWE